MRPPKIDFRFLIYTLKNRYIWKKKHGLKSKIYLNCLGSIIQEYTILLKYKTIWEIIDIFL